LIVSNESALPNTPFNFKIYHFNFRKNWNKINQRIKVDKIESYAIEKNKDKFKQYGEELMTTITRIKQNLIRIGSNLIWLYNK